MQITAFITFSYLKDSVKKCFLEYNKYFYDKLGMMKGRFSENKTFFQKK